MRVRRTSWGYVARDAIILETAEQAKIACGVRACPSRAGGQRSSGTQLTGHGFGLLVQTELYGDVRDAKQTRRQPLVERREPLVLVNGVERLEGGAIPRC